MNEKEFLQRILRILNNTTQLDDKDFKNVDAKDWKLALFSSKQIDVVCEKLQNRIDEIIEGVVK